MVVNIITKKPDENLSVNANASGGMNGHKEGFVALSKRFGDEDRNVGISAYVSWIDTDLDNFQETYPEW